MPNSAYSGDNDYEYEVTQRKESRHGTPGRKGDDQEYLRVDEDNASTAESVTLAEKTTPLPMWRKLCFAVGGAPYQTTGTVIGFFLNIFLLEVALLSPGYVSVILFGGKAWDAITDPAIGILVQKTNTRWGKMRPWMLFSAPFGCLTYFMLFYVPFPVATDVDGNEYIAASDGAKLGFYFAMYCTFQGFLTCLHVPYTSLTMYVATRQKDRDSITALRMGFEALGVLFAVIVQGVLVSGERCNGDEKVSSNTTLTSQGDIDREALIDAYVHGSSIVIVFYMVCVLVCFFGTKEKQGIINDKTEQRMGFFQGIKLVFSFKPYVWASFTFLFYSMAIQIIQGNIALYATHTLKQGKNFSKFIIVLLVVVVVSMPFWQLMIRKIGKKKVYAAGMILFIPILIVQLYLPPNTPYIYGTLMGVAGMCVSVGFLLPWSVLPDVIDLYTLQNKTRHDALFYAFYVFFNKLGVGLALAASQVALQLGGYESGVCSQPERVEETLRYLVVPGPVVLTLMALVCLYFYPIDEDLRMRVRKRIEENDTSVELSLRT